MISVRIYENSLVRISFHLLFYLLPSLFHFFCFVERGSKKRTSSLTGRNLVLIAYTRLFSFVLRIYEPEVNVVRTDAGLWIIRVSISHHLHITEFFPYTWPLTSGCWSTLDTRWKSLNHGDFIFLFFPFAIAFSFTFPSIENEFQFYVQFFVLFTIDKYFFQLVDIPFEKTETIFFFKAFFNNQLAGIDQTWGIEILLFASKKKEKEKKLFFMWTRLLYSVLPISVANELRHSRPVPAKKYDCVTLLFSGIVGFGAYCAAHTDSSGAMKIVNMLNQLYIAFDVLTDPKKNPNVYKVQGLIIRNISLLIGPKISIQTQHSTKP